MVLLGEAQVKVMYLSYNNYNYLKITSLIGKTTSYSHICLQLTL